MQKMRGKEIAQIEEVNFVKCTELVRYTFKFEEERILVEF